MSSEFDLQLAASRVCKSVVNEREIYDEMTVLVRDDEMIERGFIDHDTGTKAVEILDRWSTAFAERGLAIERYTDIRRAFAQGAGTSIGTA